MVRFYEDQTGCQVYEGVFRQALRKEAPEEEGWHLYEDQLGCKVYEGVFRKALRKEASEKEGWHLYEDQEGCKVYEGVYEGVFRTSLTSLQVITCPPRSVSIVGA